MTAILALYVIPIAAGVFVGSSIWRVLRWAGRFERRIEALERAVMPPPPAGPYRMASVVETVPVVTTRYKMGVERFPVIPTGQPMLRGLTKAESERATQDETWSPIIPPDPKEVSE